MDKGLARLLELFVKKKNNTLTDEERIEFDFLISLRCWDSKYTDKILESLLLKQNK